MQDLPLGTDNLLLGIEAAIAIGIGLFVGLEREHRHVEEGEPEKRTVLGVRTFALFSLLGWLVSAFAEDWPWLPPAMLLIVGALIAAQYLREEGERRLGLTTEVAALVVFVLGMLVHHEQLFAVGLALITTLLLISKPWVRTVVPALRRVELTSTLQLAILLAIVLPLLPNEPVDPWGVIPPRKIGLFVVLVAGIGFVGYVLSRALGASRAAGVTGAVGGLVSSTALTAAMARQARSAPGLVVPSQGATIIASAVSCARLLVIVFIVNRAVAVELVAPLLGMSLVLIVPAFIILRRGAAGRVAGGTGGRGKEGSEHEVRNPFALLPALKWGLFLCCVLLVAHAASHYFGGRGLLAAAAAAGLADVDAISLAASRQAAAGTVDVGTAVLAIVIAVIVNMIVKTVIGWVAGGREFGTRVAVVFGIAIAVGVAAAIATVHMPA